MRGLSFNDFLLKGGVKKAAQRQGSFNAWQRHCQVFWQAHRELTPHSRSLFLAHLMRVCLLQLAEVRAQCLGIEMF